eukprot:scaffold146146_cov50-Prasinocladus_malaysianus.AAC.1
MAPMLLEEAAKRPEPPRPDPKEQKRLKEAAEQERRRERAESYKAAGNTAFKDGSLEISKSWGCQTGLLRS